MEIPTLEHWVNINSGTHNREGLRLMADALQEHLAELPGTMERISLPAVRELDGSLFTPGDALRLKFRPEAPVQVLFNGHMDTVYGAESPFQRMIRLDDGRVNGPGVADMKGGLFIMIEALSRYLKADTRGNIGGEILITADEEIGSPASHDLLLEAAGRHHIGLVYESALPGGELVCRRKGTGTFRITTTGKSAHTGRDFANGRNALVALSSLAVQLHALNTDFPDGIVNIGRIRGGGPVNVVPDSAEAWVNVRAGLPETAQRLESAMARQIEAASRSWEGIRFHLEGSFSRPPKEESPGDASLHALWNEAERKLGLPESGKRETGGSSDGNLFSAAGLPHLDGVGIRGGAIHSEEEFAILESIPEQIERTIAFLERVAATPDAFTHAPFRNPA